MRERKFELMAWMVFEVGKNWAEADGDIAELIDFCDFYALEAIRLSKAEIAGAVARRARLAALHPARRRRGDSAVELSRRHHGRHDAGVHRVRQHRHPEAVERFAHHRRQVLRDPGRSRPARRRGQLLSRSRQQFGNAIVEHPKTRYIAFTGSKEVGLHINQRAAIQQPGQIWIKRTVLEMGGKDSIIVDADADLDAAVEGVASAAFGFSGQKCSACSRAIVDERIYDRFVQRLGERVEKITVGDPSAESRTWAR